MDKANCIDCKKELSRKDAKRCKSCSMKGNTRLDGHRQKGKNHWNWKGGKSSDSYKIRRSRKYKSWRTAVFERDDYTCRGCGVRGVCLEAHHIKSFAEHKDLRFVIDNGITYCVDCHIKNDKHREVFK